MESINKNDELKIIRVFDAQRELVWKAWTDPDLLMRWWGPMGFTAPVAKMDLRVGGEYLNCMRSPDGRNYWSKGVYREIIPEEKLVMTDSFSDDEGNVVPSTYYGMSGFPMEMLISVTFEEKGNRTMLTLVHSGIESVNDIDRGNMHTGWSQSLDKLAKLLSQTKSGKLAA